MILISKKQRRDWQLANAARKWRERHPRKALAVVRSYQERNPIAANAWKRTEVGKSQQRDYAKLRNREFRRQVLFHYSGGVPQCSCCGESELVFLAVDHVNNDGNIHRKRIKQNLCQWLVLNGFPDGFQILCFNCNMAKHLLGVCPHQALTEVPNGR